MSNADAASAERAALRSALVQLLASDERLPATLLPAFAGPGALPDVSLLLADRVASSGGGGGGNARRFRERRLGLSAAPADVLDASLAGALAGAAPVVIPADRLATVCAFSGAAEGAGEAAKKQREMHRASLALVGLFDPSAAR
jgi:hypothetical protein